MNKKLTKTKTREQILHHLKMAGPQEAAVLAENFGLTAMAIRQHLYDLEKSGEISHTTQPRPKGRPAKVWHLTEKSNSHFANSHADLALGLISSVKTAFGEEGMEKLLDIRFHEQVDDYSRRLKDSQNLEERLENLALIRTKEGYMADVLDGPEDQYLFVENHCPVCQVAKTCSGICARELEVFKEIMGDDISVERTEHITQGARRCAYAVKPKSKSD